MSKQWKPKPDEEGVIDKDVSDTDKINLPDETPEKGSEGL